MTVSVTAIEMTDITGMTAEQAGEVGSDAAIRDRFVVKASRQFEKDVERTFTGTEDDYEDAKDAVAFLAAYLISRTLLPAVSEGGYRSSYLDEYRRLLKLLKGGKTDTGEETKYFGGHVETSETVDLSENYQEDGHSKET